MSISDLIGAVALGKIDPDNTTTINLVPICRVSMDKNHLMSKCAHFIELRAFVWTRSSIFNRWWQRQEGYNSSLSADEIGNRQK